MANIQENKYYFSNTSITKINPNIYLYAVKAIWSDYIDDIIPGNGAGCNKPSIGKNYWWNHWDNKHFHGETLFFIGNHNDHLTLYNTNISIYDQDIRVFSKDNQLYAHNNDIKYLYKLDIDFNTKTIYFSEVITGLIYQQGSNQQIIDMDFVNQYYQITYIDDFNYDRTNIFQIIFDPNIKVGPDKIRAKEIDVIDKSIPQEQFKFRTKESYDNKNLKDIRFLGTNYEIMPEFSLSTSIININNDIKLGIGHTKIHPDKNKFPYLSGSKIK